MVDCFNIASNYSHNQQLFVTAPICIKKLCLVCSCCSLVMCGLNTNCSCLHLNNSTENYCSHTSESVIQLFKMIGQIHSHKSQLWRDLGFFATSFWEEGDKAEKRPVSILFHFQGHRGRKTTAQNISPNMPNSMRDIADQSHIHTLHIGRNIHRH